MSVPWQRAGDPEAGQQPAARETSDRADPVAPEGEHHHAARPPDRRAWIGKVVDERGLAVGPGADDLELGTAEGEVSQESGDRRGSAELGGVWWHGAPGVLGQH